MTLLSSNSKRSVLKRNSRLQVEKGSAAAERTDLNGLQGMQKSIFQTLKYSDHFGFPLSLEEIHLRFVGANPCIRPLIQKTINQMLKQNRIEKLGDYYYLPGHKSLVARRLKRAKLSSPQLALAHKLASKLSKISGILAIYLTGSLALSNTEGTDDIDLMIITTPGRLWTTRFLLTLYTEFLGLRRRPKDHDPSGKLCLNLYLTPDSYCLPISKQSLYTAYELIQAVPLYDPTDTRSSLLAANSWIHSYLPNATRTAPSPRSDLLRRRPKGVISRLQNTIRRPGRTFLELIEFCCYHLQLFYMRGKITKEYITKDSAFFHPNDPSPRGLSLKGIPGCKPRRARRQAKGQSSTGLDV